MSAYVVDPFTIHLLLTAAPDRLVLATLRDVYPEYYDDRDMIEARSTLGRYLWSMNIRSVLYRYPSDTVDTMPGSHPDGFKTGTTYHPLPEYEYHRTRIGHHASGAVRPMSKTDAARVLGAAFCYRYQSCELPEWDRSPAAEFVRGVIDHAAHALTDDWEYTATDDGASALVVGAA